MVALRFLPLALVLAACDKPAPAEAPPPAGCSPDMVEVEAQQGTTFCLDVALVSVASYQECVGRAHCSAPDPGRGCLRDDLTTQQKPINCVDFAQADAYCKAQKKRLPTVEEIQAMNFSPARQSVAAVGLPEWTASPGPGGAQRMTLRDAPYSRLPILPEAVPETSRGVSLGFRCAR